MITITAGEDFRIAEPEEELDEKQLKVWNFYFNKCGFSMFLVDADTFLVIQENGRLENALIFQCFDSVLDWLSENYDFLKTLGKIE